MPSPFQEDDRGRDSADAADDKLIEGIKDKMSGPEGTPDENQPLSDRFDDFVVDLDDSDDDQDGDEPQMSRKDKKRNRYREALERAEAAEKEAAAVKARLDAVERRMVQPPPVYQPPTPTEDPSASKLREIREQQKNLRTVYGARISDRNNPPSQEELNRLDQQFSELEDKATEIIVERKIGSRVSNQPNDGGLNQMLQARYLDLVSNPQARQSALGLYMMKVAEGATPGIGLLDDVADETYKRFRIGPYRKGVPPSKGAKHKLSGNPAGSADRPSGNSSPRTITMNKDMRKMADAWGPHLPPKERYVAWAKGPGAKAMAAINAKKA